MSFGDSKVGSSPIGNGVQHVESLGQWIPKLQDPTTRRTSAKLSGKNTCITSHTSIATRRTSAKLWQEDTSYTGFTTLLQVLSLTQPVYRKHQ